MPMRPDDIADLATALTAEREEMSRLLAEAERLAEQLSAAWRRACKRGDAWEDYAVADYHVLSIRRVLDAIPGYGKRYLTATDTLNYELHARLEGVRDGNDVLQGIISELMELEERVC